MTTATIHSMVETISPEQAGLSAIRMQALHATMQAFVDEGKIAGLSTLIMRHGQVVDARCYGQLDIAANKPIQPDSLFRIYSLTKPITSVAALMLHDEGRFDLDEPVCKWLPGFKNFKVSLQPAGEALELGNLEKEITFRHLLTHTSGLAYGFMGGPIEDLYAGERMLSPIVALQMPLLEIIEKLPGLPLVAQPGTIWSYSLAHDVVGYLIEVITGQPFDAFLRERIFDHLGMPDTGFFVPPDKLDRLGPMYRAKVDKQALIVADEVAGSPFASSKAVASGGAGLVSSMPDYLRFATMLANGGELNGVRILSPSSFTAMTTNQLPRSAYSEGGFDAGDGYGLGVGVRVTADAAQGMPAGSFGWGGASGTKVLICPREEMIVISMAQSFIDVAANDKLQEMAYAAIVT